MAAQSPQHLREAFDLFDTNKDGTISRDEFVAALVRKVPGCDNPITADEAHKEVDALDVNSDGVLSYEEFVQRWYSISPHLKLGISIDGIYHWLEVVCKGFSGLTSEEAMVAHFNDTYIKPKNEKRRMEGKGEFPQSKTFNGYINQHYLGAYCKTRSESKHVSYCELTCKEHVRSAADAGVSDGANEQADRAGGKHTGTANVFVSWYLDTPMSTLLSGLESYLVLHGRPRETTFFWICDFVIRQTDVGPDLEQLGACVEHVGQTALLATPYDAPGPLKRAYCVKELYYTALTAEKKGTKNLDLAMPPEDETLFQAKKTDYVNGGRRAIEESFRAVDVMHAQCMNVDEQNKILESISKLKGGAEGLNKTVRNLLLDQMGIKHLGEVGAKNTAEALKGSRLTAL